jgi:NAD(P)-dependent dehydrogenase (short-subunit alcohol dehydrogenase family)
MSRCWEVGKRGITVNNIQPGPIDTELNPAAGEWAVPQKAVTALDRYGHVDEVAALVAFVAGPDSGYVTGTSLTVDVGDECVTVVSVPAGMSYWPSAMVTGTLIARTEAPCRGFW